MSMYPTAAPTRSAAIHPSPAQPAQSTFLTVVGGDVTDKDLHDEVAKLRTQLELVREY
jgi:hypothetical protein